MRECVAEYNYKVMNGIFSNKSEEIPRQIYVIINLHPGEAGKAGCRLDASIIRSLSTSHFGTGGIIEDTCRLFLGGGNSFGGFITGGFFLIKSMPKKTIYFLKLGKG